MESATAGLKILHVDDDESFLRLVNTRLTAEGYEMVSVTDPTRVTKTLMERGCRLAILDLDMPQMNGLELLRAIKEQDGGVQVIILTGLVSMHSVLQAMRWGAEICLFKPILDFQPLLEAIRAAFDKQDRWRATCRELLDRRQFELLGGMVLNDLSPRSAEGPGVRATSPTTTGAADSLAQ